MSRTATTRAHHTHEPDQQRAVSFAPPYEARCGMRHDEPRCACTRRPFGHAAYELQANAPAAKPSGAKLLLGAAQTARRAACEMHVSHGKQEVEDHQSRMLPTAPGHKGTRGPAARRTNLLKAQLHLSWKISVWPAPAPTSALHPGPS